MLVVGEKIYTKLLLDKRSLGCILMRKGDTQMAITVTVTRQYNNDLTQVNFYFFYFDDRNILRLRRYEEIHRESTRHKFKLIPYRHTWWDHQNNRDATIMRGNITVPEDVIAEAKQQLIDMLSKATME
jgi:hypothetical protein